MKDRTGQTHLLVEVRRNGRNYQAVCTCGWGSSAQPSDGRAIQEHDDHVLAAI